MGKLADGPNKYQLIRTDDTGGQRHGGWRTYRHFTLMVNGKEFETYRDDCQSTNYASDVYLDRLIAADVRKLRKFWPGKYVKSDQRTKK